MPRFGPRAAVEGRTIIATPAGSAYETLPSPSPDWALFLDADGTVLHLAETPDAVAAAAHLPELLARIAEQLGGALAVISGRRIADLDRLFAPAVLPLAGQHGLERRDAEGRLHRLGDSRTLDRQRASLQAFAAAHPGVTLEDKGLSLALHYRRSPEMAEPVRRAVAEATAGCEGDLTVLDGKMVIEVKLRLATKGEAIQAFLAESPFAGRRPVFLGDDVTDEDGFAAVNRLGGISIRIGEVGDTAARWHISDVDAVLEWLGGMPERLDSCEARRQA